MRLPSPELQQLARSHGLLLSYDDVEGREQVASPDALVAVLRALGAELHDEREASEALRIRHRDLWANSIDPLVAVWQGKEPSVNLRLPVQAPARGRGRLLLESGEVRTWEFELSDRWIRQEVSVDGRTFRGYAFPLPDDLPPGKHRLLLEIGDYELDTWLLVAPVRAWTFPQRQWGVFVPTYALSSGKSWGAGGLAELSQLQQWMARRGGTVVGTLPITAAFLDNPFEPSPYAPVSRLFWNELFLDLRELSAGDPNAEIEREREMLQALPEVDYRRQYALLRRVLQPLADACFASGNAPADLTAFVASNPEVVRYAQFRAVTQKQGCSWRQWPERLRQGGFQPDDWDAAAYRLHLFVQWKMSAQLQRLASDRKQTGSGLYLDLPLGVHPDGYDAWVEQERFLDNVSVGAPPDTFFTAGQNWGFAPLNPAKMLQDGFGYLERCLARQCTLAAALRIDHVMWLHRTFVIPHGMSAGEGVYLRYPMDELYALLTLESTRHRCMLVGEDLGTVPEEVRRKMHEHGVARLWVLQYETRPDEHARLSAIPHEAVGSLNTHDMPPFAGFWHGDDIDMRVAMGLLAGEPEIEEEHESRARARDAITKGTGCLEAEPPLEAILRACLEHLSRSEALLVLVNLEDLWLERRPQNVPGSGDEHPNWRRKLKHSLEEIETLPEVDVALRTIASIRKEVAR